MGSESLDGIIGGGMDQFMAVAGIERCLERLVDFRASLDILFGVESPEGPDGFQPWKQEGRDDSIFGADSQGGVPEFGDFPHLGGQGIQDPQLRGYHLVGGAGFLHILEFHFDAVGEVVHLVGGDKHQRRGLDGGAQLGNRPHFHVYFEFADVEGGGQGEVFVGREDITQSLLLVNNFAGSFVSCGLHHFYPISAAG